VTLAARVARGDADAPVLVLAAALAPLLALLASARRTPPPAPARSIRLPARVGCAALLMTASLLAAGDLAWALGAARWQGVIAAAALAALPALVPGERWALLLPLGLAALAGGTLVTGLVTPAPPWRAWADAAGRPAFRFGAHGAWVDDGGRVDRRVTLEFTEGQRVTAVASGTFRVVEREPWQTTTRDWRLAAGDTLALRSGDRLTLEPGARVRFEAGGRVPGAPISGAEWADPAERRQPRRLVAWLGAFVTLGAGALPLARAATLTRPGALAAVTSALGLPLLAAVWGIYAATAPERLLGGADGAVLAALPASPGAGGVGVAPLACVALAALLLAAVHGLRGPVARPRSPWGELVWLAVLVASALGALWPLDPWRALTLGWGLAAAALGAPALGARDAGAATAGAWAGAGAWAAVVVLDVGDGLAPWARGLGDAPALAAAPLGWLVARVVSARAGNGRAALTQ
jgi:hypothetical protein